MAKPWEATSRANFTHDFRLPSYSMCMVPPKLRPTLRRQKFKRLRPIDAFDRSTDCE